MSAITCDRCRGLLIGDADAAGARADIAAHLGGCAQCRAFAEALRAGDQAWLGEDHAAFRDGVLARTSEAEALAVELRDLAEMDPGPGFTERVLLHTSRRPAAQRWHAPWAAQRWHAPWAAQRWHAPWAAQRWRALVRRPRFAWEVAYAVTLCLVLAAGSPLSAWEWGSQRMNAIAQQPIGKAATSLRQDLETWRAILVADTSAGDATAATAGQSSTDSQSAFEAAWQLASRWVGSRLAQVVDAFIDLWQRAAAWIIGSEPAGEPAAGTPPPATEPRGDTARSPQ
jgi:hypothetical protein